MIARSARVTDRLHVGDAATCRAEAIALPTLHIQSPSEAACPDGMSDYIDCTHGASTAVWSKGGQVIIWNEYRERLTPSMLHSALDWYQFHAPEPVFVHCAAGRHRSVTLCIALMLTDGLALPDALALICSAMDRYPDARTALLEADDLQTVISWAGVVNGR